MDNSWDNGGGSAPLTRHGAGWARMFTWLVVLMIVVGLGATGVVWWTRNQPKLEQWAQDYVEADWAEARLIVTQLRTEDGTRSLYRANPALGRKFSSESEFLKTAASWRERFGSLPESLSAAREGGFGHRIGLGKGPAILSVRMKNGVWLILSWDGPNRQPQRQLVDIEVNGGAS